LAAFRSLTDARWLALAAAGVMGQAAGLWRPLARPRARARARGRSVAAAMSSTILTASKPIPTEVAMALTNTDMFNEQLTRAIAMLYKAHPTPISYFPSDSLWTPEITERDADYQNKSSVSGGTLTWLHRNNFISGQYSAKGFGSEIVGAQLTGSGYRIACTKEGNYGNRTLGEIACSAQSDRDFEFVAARFVGA
jgi:hypothetical protein